VYKVPYSPPPLGLGGSLSNGLGKSIKLVEGKGKGKGKGEGKN